MSETLPEGILRLCRRVRETLLPRYEALGPAGVFGALMLKQEIAEGEAAVASGDAVRMVAAYKRLESCE